MRLFLALFGFMMISSSMFACSCVGPTTFCNTLQAAYGNGDFNIVIGTKGALHDEYIDFHINKSLYGEAIPSKIKIEFGYGADCRVSTQYWDENIQYILILRKPLSGDTYGLSICSYAVLKLENNMVTGFIDEPEEQTIPYSEFLKTLDCFDGDLNYVNILINQLIGDQIAFTNLTNLQTDVLANIVDTSGRQIFSRQMQFNGYERQFIDLPYDLPCGIYIVVFSQDGIKQSHKIYL